MEEARMNDKPKKQQTDGTQSPVIVDKDSNPSRTTKKGIVPTTQRRNKSNDS